MRRRNLFLGLAVLLLAVGVGLFIRQASQLGDLANAGKLATVAPVAPRTTTVVSAAGAPALLAGQRAAGPTDPVTHRFQNTTNKLEALGQDDRAIILENALIDTRQPLNFSIPESLQAAAEPGTYLVQAQGVITERFRATLAAAGATVLAYVPNNAYQVAATAAVAEQLARQPDVQAVLPFEPVYKLKAELLDWALEEKSLPEGSRLNLLLTPGLQAAARDALAKAGVTIVAEAASPFGPVVTVMPGADWSSVARLAGVQGVELARARISANDLTRERLEVATNSVISTNYLGLTGTNVVVGLNDTGVSTNHPDLINRIIPWSALAGTDTNGHGTHVAGIIAGSGAESLTATNVRGSISPTTTNQFRGMAPAARLLVQSLDLGGAGVTDEALQVNAARTNAFISNNSWHYANSYTYDLAASSFDAAVRDALPGVTGSQPQLYVFAAGNQGNGGDEGLGGAARSIPSPGSAKNVITVGALEQARDITNIVTKIVGEQTNTSTPWQAMTSSDQQVAGFSGRGNVGVGIEGTYGRFKPDVVAPGTFVLSTRSTTWDEKAYYNPTSHLISTERRLVATNAFDYPFGGVPLPLNAVGFSIRIVPNQYSPVPFPNLPIYVDTTDYPTAFVYDFIKTNAVFVPPDAGGVLGGETWYYGIRNQTTQELDFNVIVDIVVTNEYGDQLTVMSNLNNSISSGAPHHYRYESGTSMSAASVSGMLALMQQFFQERGVTNSPAMMKALLINGARSVDSSLYNFLVRNTINYQGWGLPKLPNSIPAGLTTNLNLLPATAAASNSIYMFDQSPTNALATGQSQTWKFTVSEDGRTLPLRVTLVWTDPPGNPAAGIKLVNDLDLVVTNLDNPANPIIYYGNNFPAGQFTTASGTNTAPNQDFVNNVENIFINADLGSNYTVTVSARRVNVNAVTAHTNGVVQDFALVVSSGGGEAGDALSLIQPGQPITGTNASLAAVDIITNIFVGDGFSSAGLEGQRVGANSPLMGTLTGTTNQWHFYVITNTSEYTNASFLTSAARDLSIPRGGVNESLLANATRVYADLDLYVTPNNPGLLQLAPAVVAASDKSLSRNTFNGDEAVIYSNSVNGTVYYIGVKSEDYQAAEFELWAIFSLLPLGQEDENGFIRAYPFSPGDGSIPSGPNDLPGVAKWRAFTPGGGDIRRVVITNSLIHQRLDDVVGSVVSPAGKAVTLNNHKRLTTPTAPGPYNFLYEDNDEGDFLDAIHPDGPGHLYDYVGEKKSGQWKFFFVDNVLSATGRVEQLRIRLEEQCEAECNMTNAVAAQSWRYFSKNVSVEATNMTVCVNIITPTDPQPLELYIRKGAFPTRTAYDFKQTIVPPGGCLSIDKFQLPPLSPGRYFIGVFNPSASSQTFYINITVEEGPAPAPYTFNPIGSNPLLDDAVTNYTQTVTDHMQIARLDVGLAIAHPRVSDLAVTLISPSGTRVLLAENRGGTNTNGFGSTVTITNFIPISAAGGPAATNIFIDTGATAGIVTIDYDFYSVPDQMRVYYEGNLLADTGMIDGAGRLRLNYGPGATTIIEVRINELGNTNSGTAWDFTASSYSVLSSYLVFTDNTNLTTTPIKFALPPYVGDGGTNYPVSDFEVSTVNQDYFGPTTGTPDGWSVVNSNTVTVITNTAFNGTNSFALRSGVVSRTINTTPGRAYRLGYAYRQTLTLNDMVAWYPADNSPVDVIANNNATLLNGAGYTVGRVGGSFNLDGGDDRITASAIPALNFGPGVNFTFEGWIRALPTANSFGVTTILDKRFSPNTTQCVGIGLNLQDGNLAIQLSDGPTPTASWSYYVSAGPNLQDGNWHHIAASVQRNSTTGGRLYVDGVSVLTFDPTLEPGDLSTTQPLRLGNHDLASLNCFFRGAIDEMTVYRRALAQAEIQAIYNAGAAGKCGMVFPPSICAPPSGAQVFVPGVVTNSFLGSTNWQTGGLAFNAAGANTVINLAPMSTNASSGVLVDYFTVTEMASPRYVLPEESLTAFEGEYADGVWRLEILDTRTGATNNVALLDWQLQFVYQTNTAPPRVLDPGTPVDVTLPAGQIIYFIVDAPSFARFATNVLYNSSANVSFYFNQNTPPGYGATNVGDVVLTPLPANTGAQNWTETLSTTNTAPPASLKTDFIAGRRYYLAVENSGGANVTFTVYVDFDLRAFPPVVPLTNGVPYCAVNPTPLSLDYYHFVVSSNAVRAQFELAQLTGDMTLILRRGLPPSFNSFDYLSANVSTNDEIITVFDFTQPVPLAPGDWYFAAANLSPGPVAYCATAWEWPAYGTNIVITNTFLGTNSFCLTWTSLPGVRYVVEGVTNLNSTNWVAVSPTITGAGATTTYCVPLPSPYQFFRVREGQTQTTYVPPPYIIRIAKRFNGIEIVWSGPPGQQYKVEWSPTLVPATWTQFAETITSITGIYGYLDDGSQTGGFGATRYYRLVLLP